MEPTYVGQLLFQSAAEAKAERPEEFGAVLDGRVQKLIADAVSSLDEHELQDTQTLHAWKKFQIEAEKLSRALKALDVCRLTFAQSVRSLV